MRPAKIVSGGQTGVDRGALDAALESGWPCGGWCPAGRVAEDGRIPDRYPLVPTREADSAVRTRRNVEDSDGTLILCPGEPNGGTRLTADVCADRGRPCLVVDAEALSVREAAALARTFVTQHRIAVLNVAGPRASGWPEARRYARGVVAELIAVRSGGDP